MQNNAFRFRYELKQEAETQSAEVMLYGEIASYKFGEDDPSVTAKDFDRMLKEAKANGAKKLKMRINSPGGSVWQAVAMRSMLMTSDFERIDISIEGLCASAATLFVCIPNARVAIAEGSEFMIHNPFTVEMGTAEDFEKCAKRLHKIEDENHIMYAERTGQTEEQIKQWMDEETWFTAREAVQYGFADELIRGGEIAASVSGDMMKWMKGTYRNVPDMISETVQTVAEQSMVTDEPKAEAGVVCEIENSEEEETKMEIKDITIEQLKAENPELYLSIVRTGAENERERIAEIDDMTPAGYEELAQNAKETGMDSVTYMKALVKAQREKGANYMAARKQETQVAAQVAGGAAEDSVSDQEAMNAFAKEIGSMAASNRYDMGSTMY